ncbi:hypothetical protein [Streptomyces sp. IBSBF 2950]|uniref:hypothetical protein n=1 Tax=Streptomyces sp. IBSBF 2950 TaxID=2903528 RepID=UPI002FDC27C5
MDMPINIVPARPGAAVALYLATNDKRIAEAYGISLALGGGPLDYILKEVVGWGVFADISDDVMTAPLVMDERGFLTFARSLPCVPEALATFDPVDDLGAADVVCTPGEAEAMVNDIANRFGVDKMRTGFARLVGPVEYLPELPADFRI